MGKTIKLIIIIIIIITKECAMLFEFFSGEIFLQGR